MFEQSLVETTHRVGTRKPAVILTSLLVQFLVVFVMAVIPLIYYNVLPAKALMGFLSAPPPPPPPPPPPTPVPKVVVHHLVSEVTQSGLVAPREIPKTIERVVESAPPPVALGNTGSGDFSSIGAALDNMPKAAPPPPPPPPEKMVVGGDVMKGQCVACPQPPYPRMAQQAHISGAVVFKAVIGKDGLIKNLELVSGNGILAGPTKQVIQGWKYSPYLLDGVAVEVDTTITVNFNFGG